MLKNNHISLILQHIAKNGTCDDIYIKDVVDICKLCPLSKIKKRPDGSGWLSCLDSIIGSNFENVKEKYKEAASNELLNIAISDVLDEQD